MPRKRKRLTSLPGRLHAAGYRDVPPYKAIHMHAVNAVIPGAHQVNSIWHFYEDDVPDIATALGLTAQPRQSVAA